MNARRWLPLALVAALSAPAHAEEAADVAAQMPPAPPYLQDGQVGRTTLVWRTATPAPGQVAWFPEDAPQRLNQVVTPKAGQHEVVMRGLVPGAWHRWRAMSGDQAWEGRFRANRGPEATHLRFAVVGDLGSGAPAEAAIAARMAAWQPDHVVAVGDIVYHDGAPREYAQNFFEPYGALLAGTVFYPSLGNHDVRTAHGAPYLAAFSLPDAAGTERYYTFTNGPAQFWALDSTQAMGPGSPQHAWFVADAARSTARWKLAFFHHPPYSTGLHGSNYAIRRDLGPVFSRLGFDLVLTGHDHHYERFEPVGGVTYVVSGGGGGLLYRAVGGPGTAAVANAHHFVAVTIAGDTLALQARGLDDRVLDVAAIRKRR